jgi:exopolysaccharide biosynthesis polyprenyl glycosylphosphotransferase
LGTLHSVVDAVRANGIKTVIVAGSVGTERRFLKNLGWELEETGTSLVLASQLTDIAGPRIHWRPIDGLPLMSVELPQYSGLPYFFKRLLDFIASAIAIAVFSPILLAVAVAIKLEDSGPVLFRQHRVGIRGTEFQMHKFRSMHLDADARVAELAAANEGQGVLFKIKDDPRITRVGSFIRKYSLDELPQLFNVLAGRMSLVGPRPPLPREVAAYEDHTHRRLNVRPGITGLWQVSGRSNLSWEESVRLDLYYVENWSLAGDIIILFRTVKAVLTKDGAY